MVEFLQHLVQLSEKAACIARAFKPESGLFVLPVQEKRGEAKNKRFVQDFKTLADVLIQEVVRYNLIVEFPQLADCVFGEETNVFTDQNGAPVTIEVQSTQEGTSKLLTKLLGQEDDHLAKSTADVLASIVHSNVTEINLNCVMPHCSKGAIDLPKDKLAVWIDPIDGTGQYVSNTMEVRDGEIIIGGIACATVLIGLFDQDTGKPIAGVVNQPYARRDELIGQWSSYCVWGAYHDGTKLSNCYDIQTINSDKPLRVAISSSEHADIKKVLKMCGLEVYAMAGVGYKLLSVINRVVDFFILTKDSSFKWDTCGPHAILNSLGGGIVPYQQALAITNKVIEDEQMIGALKEVALKYNKPDKEISDPGKKWSNTEGLIAFRTYSSVISLLRKLIEIQRNECK